VGGVSGNCIGDFVGNQLEELFFVELYKVARFLPLSVLPLLPLAHPAAIKANHTGHHPDSWRRSR